MKNIIKKPKTRTIPSHTLPAVIMERIVPLKETAAIAQAKPSNLTDKEFNAVVSTYESLAAEWDDMSDNEDHVIDIGNPAYTVAPCLEMPTESDFLPAEEMSGNDIEGCIEDGRRTSLSLQGKCVIVRPSKEFQEATRNLYAAMNNHTYMYLCIPMSGMALAGMPVHIAEWYSGTYALAQMAKWMRTSKPGDIKDFEKAVLAKIKNAPPDIIAKLLTRAAQSAAIMDSIQDQYMELEQSKTDNSKIVYH